MQNYEDAASFEVADIPSVRRGAFPPHSRNDPTPTFEINPDFSHDRSQQHFLVSPEPPPKIPSSPEGYFPVKSSTTTPGRPTPPPSASETLKTADPLTPQRIQARQQKRPASLMPPEKKALFFSSESSKNPAAIDSMLIRVVCSEPLLSEAELLLRLKETMPDLTKRLLRQALVRNGLDTDYKRFRAYMTG
ncbi:MAG: hypothetical protein JXA18_12150 [Chitinispirillaceae bacterium]|nr:hypothetical protein [Chitinispirillaceae bacterium]